MAASTLTSAMAASPHLSRGASTYRSSTEVGASGFVDCTSPILRRDCNPLQLAIPALFSSKRVENKRLQSLRCRCSSSRNYDRIPKQFREENLKDGLMENYKNVPSYLYGLSPSQMDMFMTEDSLVDRQSQKVTEDSISSARNYLENSGIWSLSEAMNGPSKYSMSTTMYRGGRGYGRARNAPPDLPSLILDARIVYLGMPLVPAVTELIVAQIMWLEFDEPTKPIYLYINSSGTQNLERENIASETEAYAIADKMCLSRSKFYTVNVGMAFGQAGMLLSLGAKGYRALQPHACTKLYLPKIHKSSGSVTDMWIKAKELDTHADYYLEFLSKGTGKPKEELAESLKRNRFFLPKDAIAFGIADRIIESSEHMHERKNYDELMAKSKAMRMKGASFGPPSASSGFR